MLKVAAWNLRGLNDPLKQVEVGSLIRQNKLSIVGILETHVQEVNKVQIRNNIQEGWHFVDNYINNNSGRIWIGWNPLEVTIAVLHSSPQSVFLDVSTSRNFNFILTFVYGFNDPRQRLSLWNELEAFDDFNNRPWMIMRDFNSILYSDEKVGGAAVTSSQMVDFQNCIQAYCLFDLHYSGCLFTWCNEQQGDGRIASNLDRILVNLE